jgi:hypothetical protein
MKCLYVLRYHDVFTHYEVVHLCLTFGFHTRLLWFHTVFKVVMTLTLPMIRTPRADSGPFPLLVDSTTCSAADLVVDLLAPKWVIKGNIERIG